MRWVQGPFEADEKTAKVSVVITAEHPLFGAGPVPAYGALEYMAQAAAAHAGWLAQSRGEAPRPGMLASCRSLELKVAHFKIGWELSVSAQWIGGEGEARIYQGAVRKLPEGDLLAQGQMTLILA